MNMAEYDELYPEPKEKVLKSNILKDEPKKKVVPKKSGITLTQKQVDEILVSLDKIGTLAKACMGNCTKVNLNKIIGLTKELNEIFE